MSQNKRTRKQSTAALPVISPLQPDIIDADKVPVQQPRPDINDPAGS